MTRAVRRTLLVKAGTSLSTETETSWIVALIQEGHTIVTLEPSCRSALTDDLPDLIEDEAIGERMTQNVMPVEDFLLREVMNGNIRERFTSPVKKLLVHGHCHQKALYGTRAMHELLGMVEGLEMS